MDPGKRSTPAASQGTGRCPHASTLTTRARTSIERDRTRGEARDQRRTHTISRFQCARIHIQRLVVNKTSGDFNFKCFCVDVLCVRALPPGCPLALPAPGPGRAARGRGGGGRRRGSRPPAPPPAAARKGYYPLALPRADVGRRRRRSGPGHSRLYRVSLSAHARTT